MSRFRIHAVTIHGTQYAGIKGWQLDSGRVLESAGSDGNPYETAHFELQHKPVVELTTYALKTIIALLATSSDLPLLSLNGTTGIVLYGLKAAANLPGDASGSVNLTRTMLRGALFAHGVRWSPGQKAELMLRAMGVSSNGSAAVFTESVAAAAPAAVLSEEGFVLTSLTINGSAITALNSLELTFDPKLEHEFSAGLPYPTALVGAGAKGPLEIRLSADVGDADLGSGTGAVAATFTKLAHGGTLGTDTVTFTLNGNYSIEEGLTAEHGSPISRRLVVRPRYASATRPLTWAVGP